MATRRNLFPKILIKSAFLLSLVFILFVYFWFFALFSLFLFVFLLGIFCEMKLEWQSSPANPVLGLWLEEQEKICGNTEDKRQWQLFRRKRVRKCTLRRGLENSEITLAEQPLQAQTKGINFVAKNWLHTDKDLKQCELCTEKPLEQTNAPCCSKKPEGHNSEAQNVIKSINVSAPVYM